MDVYVEGLWPVTPPPPERKGSSRGLSQGKGGRGSLRRLGKANSGRRERIKLVQGIFCMAELAVVRVIPGGVIRPPAPCHLELEPPTAILPILTGVQDAVDLEFLLRGVLACYHWVGGFCLRFLA